MGLVSAATAERPAGPQRHEEPAGEHSGAPAAADAVTAAREAAIPAAELPGSPDDRLVRAAVAGQREAFAELVRRYTNLLYWYVHGRVKDQGEIEEITQEAMVRAYVDLPKLRAPRAFANWLLAIAGCVVHEKRRRDSKIINLGEAEIPAQGAETRTPPELLSKEELRTRITAEMERLPPHYRVALALKYMNGLSVDSISERLMIPAGTVRSRLSRAYAILQRRLEGQAGPVSEEPEAAPDEPQ